jgi:hypothetical protein
MDTVGTYAVDFESGKLDCWLALKVFEAFDSDPSEMRRNANVFFSGSILIRGGDGSCKLAERSSTRGFRCSRMLTIWRRKIRRKFTGWKVLKSRHTCCEEKRSC